LRFVVESNNFRIFRGVLSRFNLLSRVFTIFLHIGIAGAQPGALDFSFDPGMGPDQPVTGIINQRDGKIIIIGNFENYDGIPRSKIARINTDGSLDSSFDPGNLADTYGNLLFSIQSDGKMILGGDFSNKIARLNIDGSLDTIFELGKGFSGNFRVSAIQNDGKNIIIGFFDVSFGPNPRTIARLNVDGSLDNSFDPGIGVGYAGRVYATHIQNDGKIIISGSFFSYNQTPRNKLARLNSDGSLDTTFNAGNLAEEYGNSYIFIQSDGKIIIGGSFHPFPFDKNPISKIARLNVDGTLDTTFNLEKGLHGFFGPLAFQKDGKIIIGGKNLGSTITPAIQDIARLNTDGSIDATFGGGNDVVGFVYAAYVQNDGKVVIGGDFTSYNGKQIKNIARIDAAHRKISQSERENEYFTIYPNPFYTTCTWFSKKDMIDATVTFYNSHGQPVKKIENISRRAIIITRDNLPSGLYIVCLSLDNQMIETKRVVILD